MAKKKVKKKRSVIPTEDDLRALLQDIGNSVQVVMDEAERLDPREVEDFDVTDCDDPDDALSDVWSLLCDVESEVGAAMDEIRRFTRKFKVHALATRLKGRRMALKGMEKELADERKAIKQDEKELAVLLKQ
jgi:hypothetical protein